VGAGGDGITIAWKDGLPDDRFERAQIEQILVESELTSRYAAIKRLKDGDDEETREELQRIAEEEGIEAARSAALAAARGAPVQEEEEPPPAKSESSKRTLARMKQERGQGDNQAGRQRKGPKLGG
jgi:hypothetical protein